MRIVICGAHVPFMSGGAELLQENLAHALRSQGHDVEIVRLPTAWDKEGVFRSAMAWRMTAIAADLVIPTNFPSYYVKHENKVAWLLHQHRGFYDMADAPWSDIGDDPDSLARQRELAEWDQVALGECRLRYTLSQVVSDRLAAFCGLSSEPLYHPPPLFDAIVPGPADGSIFTALRLEQNKRPQLLVDAMAHTRRAARLVVAGRGSMHDELHERADESRVELLGFVDDESLAARFSTASVVAYAPLDEDYGYVTLQAFAAAKPVVTCSDSGGVLEWVDHRVNGLVVDPTPAAIADAFDELIGDPHRAKLMGEAGRERVRDLSWGPVCEALLADRSHSSPRAAP